MYCVYTNLHLHVYTLSVDRLIYSPAMVKELNLDLTLSLVKSGPNSCISYTGYNSINLRGSPEFDEDFLPHQQLVDLS